MTFRWDGGFIMVSWDHFDEGVDWYTTHFGWSCLDKVITPVGKKAFLKMPRLGVVTLKSFESDFDHFKVRNNEEGYARLCFETIDLEETLAYFEKEGIQVSEMGNLPTGQKSFDILAFENARVTAVYNPSQDGAFTGVRLTGFSDQICMRIGVTNLDRSIKWYQEHVGFSLVERGQQFAHMNVEDAYDWNELKQKGYDSILLEEIPLIEYKKSSPSVRTYFDVRPEYFSNTYEELQSKGMELSEIAGNPQTGWAGFHFYDPDGNQINVWSYPLR
ncbi:VOC family protein [Bacillus salitolerans]|uniref:VOC family protein n=1 Tax=Bacillus salitolerans TaxID=1437434 RepID=A0ABW4LVD8_9BACI